MRCYGAHILELDARAGNQVKRHRHQVFTKDANVVGCGERIQSGGHSAFDRVLDRNNGTNRAARKHVVDCLLHVANRALSCTLGIGNLSERELGKRADWSKERVGAFARRVIAL